MFSNKRIIAFAIYAICLLSIPAKMIWDEQTVFHEGTAYKFKCQPADPNDPFRGKYIRLRFEPIKFPNIDIGMKTTGEIIAYGVIAVDNSGYATITKVVPEYDRNQPMVKLNHISSSDMTSTYRLPFDRLYMNENKAQAAEDLYRDALRDTTQNVYAKVFIAEGRFLLDDVYVHDIPLKEMVEQEGL